MTCEFVNQLSSLRKLSIESIDNTASFTEYKRYLHVIRPVENDLRILLRKVNKGGRKCLVLLCGSAGDGKSHLISYFRHEDDEHLIDDFQLYNDATESSAPRMTSIDTLAKKLEPFNDDNYQNDDGSKMILAINLGTLNNFIDSEKGKKYSKLKEYVEANEIFSSYSANRNQNNNSVFWHVSFSDYQMFTLRENEIGTEYLEKLIDKIFVQDESNPYYVAYRDQHCSLCRRCPVRHNYEFLSNKTCQKIVIQKIVESVIKDKEIVSTRDVLNLVYDILVHPDFSYKSMSDVITFDSKFLEQYINYTTPMLLSEFKDISILLNRIGSYETLKQRQPDIDADIIKFHALDNIYEAFLKATEGTPYQWLIHDTNIDILGGIKPEFKKQVYRFIMRTKELKGEITKSERKELLHEFLKYLYYQNIGRKQKLQGLYKLLTKAVMKWDGEFDSEYICIDDSNKRFWVIQQLQIKPDPYNDYQISDDEVVRFSTSIKLRLKKGNTEQIRTAEISMDYSLFELVTAMEKGYRPTVKDKSEHTDFVSFIQQLIEFGNKGNRIELIPKGDENSYKKIIFEENDFGYEFRVIKE